MTADVGARPLHPAARDSVDRRRLRSDEWSGHCSRCSADTTLTVIKADGRWTLRQLFGSSWTECDFDVTCRRCGSRWPAQLEGEALSVAGWLEQIRAGQDQGLREP